MSRAAAGALAVVCLLLAVAWSLYASGRDWPAPVTGLVFGLFVGLMTWAITVAWRGGSVPRS